MMHLDTVFTMVDHDKFTIHPAIQSKEGKIDVFTIEPAGDDIKISHSDDLHATMKEALGLDDLVLIQPEMAMPSLLLVNNGMTAQIR